MISARDRGKAENLGDPEICDFGERRSKPKDGDFPIREIKLRGFVTTKA